jgi:hypothetical protein
MERTAYSKFPKNRNGPGYEGHNREYRDALLRTKLRGVRYRNPSNEWLAKFIQEQLFTLDYEETVASNRTAAQEGTALIMVEQHADIALSLAHDVIVLERGTIVYSGSSEELRKDQATLDRLIGLRLTERARARTALSG